MVDGIVAYSELNNPDEAIEDVLRQISKKGNPCVIIFTCEATPFYQYTQRFKKAFPKAEVLGTTTYEAISSKGSGKNCLVAWAIMDGIEYASGVLLETTHYPMRYAGSIEKALKTFKETDNMVCLEFCTHGGNCEELVQDTFRCVLEKRHIPVAGGTAGAKDITGITYVSLNGEVYEEAAVFIMIRNLTGKVFLYKENIYKPTDTIITATDVDCEERVVYEFDSKPAAEALALKMGVDESKLQQAVSEHPLGRITPHDIYITDTRSIRPDGSISYFARIYNQTKLAIMEPGDLATVARKTASDIKSVIEKPSMTFLINCYSRIKFFERHKKLNEFYDFCKKEYGHFVGIAGFGEQVNYEHFNATMVMVVFE